MDEKEDNRLIVFIALAILVIVGTIIGLLVGCQKEEKEEPKKPQDDIVVPAKDEDKKEDEQSYDYDYEKPLPVVRKVTTKKESSTETTTEEETIPTEEETETTTHNVTFYIDEESETEEVEDGENIPSYIPTGYTDCSYYADSELTEEINLETAVTGDMEVYMTCSVVTYTIVYLVEDTESSDTYSVKDGEKPLPEPSVSEGEVFKGWYVSEAVLQKKVTAINKELIEYAEENGLIENNEICLRALIDDGTELEEIDEEVSEEETEEEQEENLDQVQTLNMEPTRGLMVIEDEELLDNEEKELDELETEEVPDEEIVTEEDKEEPNIEETVVEENKEATEEEPVSVEEPKEEVKEVLEEKAVEPIKEVKEEVKEEEEKKEESVPVVVEKEKEPEKEKAPAPAPVTQPVVVSPPENETSVEETNNSE